MVIPGPPILDIQPDQVTAHVEICSLRTAAINSGSYRSWPIDNTEFDIAGNCLRVHPSVRCFDVGIFDEAFVFGKSRWNVITAGGLYVENIGYIQGEPMHRLEKWRAAGGFYQLRDKLPTTDLRDMPGKKFLLGGDNAYWHWIANWLPRLAYFDGPKSVDNIADYRIIIVGDLPLSFLDFFRMLNIHESQLMTLPYNSNYLIRDVLVPRFFDNLCISSYAMNWIRSKFIRGATRPAGNRIYISRNDSTTGLPRRRVGNEEEILPLLEKYGFSWHLLSKYTAEEQIKLFASASVVVAPHGAGLVNMAFAPPSTPVIVFENESRLNYVERALGAMGHKVDILQCSDIVDEAIETKMGLAGHPFEARQRDMRVDPDDFARAVANLRL
jgi:capsular polysaccharide biosynthesis protein